MVSNGWSDAVNNPKELHTSTTYDLLSYLSNPLDPQMVEKPLEKAMPFGRQGDRIWAESWTPHLENCGL